LKKKRREREKERERERDKRKLIIAVGSFYLTKPTLIVFSHLIIKISFHISASKIELQKEK